jgi:hypothetical protein
LDGLILPKGWPISMPGLTAALAVFLVNSTAWSNNRAHSPTSSVKCRGN